MMVMTTLVVGIVFLQADDDFGGVQDRCVHIYGRNNASQLDFFIPTIHRMGAMFFAIGNIAFSNITAVGVFLKEKPLFV